MTVQIFRSLTRHRRFSRGNDVIRRRKSGEFNRKHLAKSGLSFRHFARWFQTRATHTTTFTRRSHVKQRIVGLVNWRLTGERDFNHWACLVQFCATSYCPVKIKSRYFSQAFNFATGSPFDETCFTVNYHYRGVGNIRTTCKQLVN